MYVVILLLVQLALVADSRKSKIKPRTTTTGESQPEILVTQGTFEHGALIVDQEGTVVRFMEDVQFGAGWDVTGIPESPFPLGWFAGIVVQADNVEIDLNGFTFAMDPAFYLKQRFFALIELGSKPFIEGQGPADFGPFVAVSDVEVHNGHLGLSAHHGIHGSDVTRARLHHLQISEFEVAAIHLNGAYKTDLEHCILGPSKKDVPVLATLSNAIFLLPAVQAAADADPQFEVTLGNRSRTLLTIAAELEAAVADPLDHPLFKNPHGLPDGSALYGLVIHRIGVAVEALGQGEDTSSKSSINIHDVHVLDLDLQVTTWAGLDTAIGPLGDRLNFEPAMDAQGLYQGNVLFDAQVALMLFVESNPGFGGPWTLTSDIGPAIQAWSVSGERLDQQPWWQVACDRDVMHHGIKGSFGMRLEFTDSVSIVSSSVRGVSGRFDGSLSSRFCANEDADLLVVGISMGKHTKIDVRDVDISNTGRSGFFTFDNGSGCRIKKSSVCGAMQSIDASDGDACVGVAVDKFDLHC